MKTALPVLLALALVAVAQPSTAVRPNSANTKKTVLPAGSKRKSRTVQKRVNTFRVATRTAAVKHVTTRAVTVSPAVRAASLAYVSERMATTSGDFAGNEALSPFFERLAKSVQEGTGLHILQYGDSHTASDDWVRAMRETFQDQYGFGGPGFTVAGHPYKGYRRFDIQGESSAGWTTSGTIGHLDDGRNGLAGISITANRPGETVALETSGDRLELYFLRQPDGGSFTLSSDGVDIATVNTAGAEGTGFYSVPTSPGEHTYTLRTDSYQPIRLFGWVSENQRGVTWETLGINGAQSNVILQWDRQLWEEQIERRNPALVIIAYGTNEASYPLWTAEQYQADLEAVIERFRSAVPDAAILLVGPPECGHTRPLAHLQEVVEIQQQVARQMGVAFWDWESHMRASGGRYRWVQAGLSQLDYTHLTGDGYRLLGKTLAEEIDAGYHRYLTQHPVAE